MPIVINWKVAAPKGNLWVYGLRVNFIGKGRCPGVQKRVGLKAFVTDDENINEYSL